MGRNGGRNENEQAPAQLVTLREAKSFLSLERSVHVLGERSVTYVTKNVSSQWSVVKTVVSGSSLVVGLERECMNA